MLQALLWDSLPNPLSFITDPLLEKFLKEDTYSSSEFKPPQKFVDNGDIIFQEMEEQLLLQIFIACFSGPVLFLKVENASKQDL